MKEFLHEAPIASRGNEEKESLINRLKRIEGQVRGIQRMIYEDRYCMDVLIQISAINAALNKVGNEITKSHIKECIGLAIEEDNGEPVIEELLKVIEQISK